MFIQAKTVFRNRSDLVTPGTILEVDETTGNTLIRLKAATEVSNSVTEQAIPAASAGKESGNTSGAKNAQNSPENAATVKGYLDGNDLNGMSFADLKALAKDMGIDTGKIRSKSGMIEAITSVEVEAPLNEDEDLPDLTPQDVVEE